MESGRGRGQEGVLDEAVGQLAALVEDDSDVSEGDLGVMASGVARGEVAVDVEVGGHGLEAGGEDAHEEDLGFGEVVLEGNDDGVDAGFGLCYRAAVSGVVGADEEDDGLGVEAGEFAVVEPPQDVGRGVAAEAKIEGFAWGVVLLPDGLEVLAGRVGLFVVLGDGVAQKQELGVLVSGQRSQDRFMAVGPPGFGEAIFGADGRSGRSRDGAGVDDFLRCADF